MHQKQNFLTWYRSQPYENQQLYLAIWVLCGACKKRKSDKVKIGLLSQDDKFTNVFINISDTALDLICQVPLMLCYSLHHHYSKSSYKPTLYQIDYVFSSPHFFSPISSWQLSNFTAGNETCARFIFALCSLQHHFQKPSPDLWNLFLTIRERKRSSSCCSLCSKNLLHPHQSSFFLSVKMGAIVGQFPA